MDSPGSDGRRGPAAGSLLSSLSNTELASIPAAQLVVRLYNDPRGPAFADVALVLAARERSAADAEARIRAADEAIGRLREEMAARALEAEEQLRRAAETEALLRAEICALEYRADEAEARAGIGFGSSHTGGPDRAGAGEDDEEDIEVDAEEIEPEVGEQDPAAANAAAKEDGDDADMDPDDSLSLNESNARGNNDDAWENNAEALALVIACLDAELELDLDDPIPLEVIPPPVSQPNSGGEEQEAADVGGGTGEEGEAQNSAQNLSRVASPVFAKGFSEVDGHRGSTSNTESSVPAMRSSREPREKGLIYNMVLKALKEKERREHLRARRQPRSSSQTLGAGCKRLCPQSQRRILMRQHHRSDSHSNHPGPLEESGYQLWEHDTID